MIHSFEKITLCFVRILGSISIIIREEHGLHCMPCFTRIISKMIPQICYHNNQVCLVPWQNVISVTLLAHQCDVRVVTVTDAIGIGACQTVYVMLRQNFNDITNWNSFNRFSQTKNYSQINTVLHIYQRVCIFTYYVWYTAVVLQNVMSNSCPPVLGDMPRALASRLSPVQTDRRCCNYLYHLIIVKPAKCVIFRIKVVLFGKDDTPVDTKLYKLLWSTFQWISLHPVNLTIKWHMSNNFKTGSRNVHRVVSF